MKFVILLLSGILSLNHYAKAQTVISSEDRPTSQPSILEFEMRETSVHSKDPSFLMSWGSDVVGKNIAHLRFRISTSDQMTYTLTYHRADSNHHHEAMTRKGVDLSLIDYQQIKEILIHASPNCKVDVKVQTATMKLLSVTRAKTCDVEQTHVVDEGTPNLQNCDSYLIRKSESPSIYASPEKNGFVWPVQKPQVKTASSVLAQAATPVAPLATEKPEEVVREEAIHRARQHNLCY